MKKIIGIILIQFFCISLHASEVDNKTAYQVALNFYKNKIKESNSSLKKAKLFDLKLTKVFYPNDRLKNASTDAARKPVLYLFCAPDNEGFVITTAETSLPPVLGYSYESTFDQNNLPPQLTGIIDRWIEVFSEPPINSADMVKNHEHWTQLLQNNVSNLKNASITNTPPLIKTKWGQGQFFNDLCPVINGSKALVGCVATAVSQIMKYWNFPEFGTGKIDYQMNDLNVSANFITTRYDWTNMPETLSTGNNAVATLCFHAAAAVETQFGPDQSSASSSSISKALTSYFNYGPIKSYAKGYDPSPVSDFESKIHDELIGGRPVLLGGSDVSNGHEYICDGEQDGYFHINYGWNGYSDGFYNLSTELQYNRYLTLTYGIKPSGILIDNKYPLLGESVKVKFQNATANSNWRINSSQNVTIQSDNADPNTKYFVFNKLGIYKIDLFEINGSDTIILNQNTINVSFSPYQKLTPTSGIVACGQSWPVRWFDFDNDGDLDLYCGYTNYIYENSGGVLIKKFPVNSTYNGSFQVFDYNNDGFLDIVQTEQQDASGKYSLNIYIYKNLNGLGFEKQDIQLPSLGGGSIIPRDLNNDGNVDLIIYGTDYVNSNSTNWYDPPYLVILLNHISSFEKVFETRLRENSRSEDMIVCNDFDNDGDIDIIARSVANTSNDAICDFIKNDRGVFTEAEISFNGNTLATGDFDNNGTNDLISPTYFFPCPDCSKFGVNIGYNDSQQFSVSRLYVDERFEYNRCGASDFNCDGKTDFFVTRTVFPSQMVGFNIFLNGSGFVSVPDVYPTYSAADADCADFNNDGYPDVAIGSAVLLNAMGKNTFQINTPPTIPINLKSSVADNEVILSWNSSIDSQTPSAGLSYNVIVGTSLGGVDVVVPMTDLTSGRRKIASLGNANQNTIFKLAGLKPGKYYWAVQAIDNGFMASKFSSYQSFDISEPQTINLAAGWNIISTNRTPSNFDMKALFQPLIDGGSLKKVMDESGKSLENLGVFGGWKNNIGNLSPSEGYKVNVTAASTLSLEGAPVQLPFDISLNTGWSIISYPATSTQDALTLFQPLITAGKLKKVMDESGKSLENLGVFGGWKNNIGNLVAGKGYKVNVTGTSTLTITESGTKAATTVPELLASIQFKPVFSGNGTDHMNINLVELTQSHLLPGDELGIFDGELCVGSATIGIDQVLRDYISIPVSANDGLNSSPNGFTEGHPVILRVYRQGKEQLLFPELLNNSRDTYSKGESMLARVSANQTAGIVDLESTAKIKVKCYPNPFSEQVTIEIQLPKPDELNVEIYDANGKLVRKLYNGKAENKTTLVWDGKNQAGIRMVPGIYFCTSNEVLTKIILEQ